MKKELKEVLFGKSLIVTVKANPKKPGTKAYDRFAGYMKRGVQTVGDAIKAGVRMDDIRHDARKGFILIGIEEGDPIIAGV